MLHGPSPLTLKPLELHLRPYPKYNLLHNPLSSSCKYQILLYVDPTPVV